MSYNLIITKTYIIYTFLAVNYSQTKCMHRNEDFCVSYMIDTQNENKT